MKEEDREDRNVRKSSRQRIPNPFYTEGINELKKAPKPPREIPIKGKKKSKVYHDQDEPSEADQIIEGEQRSEQGGSWQTCKLPNSNTSLKVQFLLQHQNEEPQKKKEDIPKIVKKNQSSFDLLSLFQKAIQNVNDEVSNDKIEISEPAKDPRIKFVPVQNLKRKANQETDGRILEVELREAQLWVRHSRLGEHEIPFVSQAKSESYLCQSSVQSFKERLASSRIVASLPIFA